MPVFNSLNKKPESETVSYFEFESENAKGNFLTKVFGAMFISLLVTAIASSLLGYMFVQFFNAGNDAALDIFFGSFVASAIGLLVLSFVLPISLRRGKHSIILYYVLYIVCMSVVLSSVFVLYDLSTLGLTFGVTSLIFGIMALLGYVSKGSFSGVRALILGLFLGAVVLSIVNFFLANSEIDWIVSFVIFAVILLVTMYDVRRIKDIAAGGAKQSYNLILYCTFMLYVDFVNIFLRVLSYISRITRKR